MPEILMRKFRSPFDFLKRLFSMFGGLIILMPFIKIDRRFREKIFLTVALANNCHG
jgi:hypothetical protein